MAYCGNCGNALEAHQRFCPKCGQPVGGQVTEQQAATAPPPPAGYYQAPSYGQAQGYAAPTAPPWPAQQRKSRLGMWIGIGAAVVVIAVACGLIFGVFKNDIFGEGGGGNGAGAGGASSPEQAVRELIAAYENQDVDAMFALIDPSSKSALLQGQSEDLAKQLLRAAIFGQRSVKFSGIELSTHQTGDSTATVTFTAGTLTVTGPDGQEVTSDVSEAGKPLTVGLVKRDGSWYVDAGSIALIGAGLGGTGPGTVTGGSGSTTSEETVP